ncbi:MBL fold metallo-hydrolase [Knoellia subterranea]|uniref:Zn-dependent hydrolase n=1 Tax=Knoellia subterranea KCTC 19937 TaxID=1385521 RepID=A0A0A0JLU1_9MICO|nr:MBL fold metallo-hydrolase [Knoellia subterranea]KGN36601.1 Zn-dependent hydrolase [Knoellia subterranea KCTC 19937]
MSQPDSGSSGTSIDHPRTHDGVRVDRVVTSGTFELDGGSWDVDNNVWVVGDDRECVVIDAAHDVDTILGAVGGRAVRAILLTHAHNDHINVANDLAAATGAPLHLHPDGRVLWALSQDGPPPEQTLTQGQEFHVGHVAIRVLHTPGHAPGACCFHVPALHVVFTGDTLFSGGPGATGRSFSSFDQIIESIREHLLTLPSGTVVLTGHGDSTTIGAEAPHLDEWIARGH